MASRDFIDSRGRAWRVWSTMPWRANAVMGAAADGWLSFESEGELRRLVPAPKHWEDASPERLELMCRVAEAVERRTGPFPKLERPAPPQESLRPPGA